MAEIQLLLADDANRQALASVLDEHHVPIVATELQEADLYLVDEPSFVQYRDELKARKNEESPVFCPVVVVRREQTSIAIDLPDIHTSERPLLVNDVVTAPVETQVLFRTVSNLLARRTETAELVSDLQERNEQLQEERRKYRTVIDQSESGIAVVQNQSFALTNERMLAIADCDRDTLRGMPVEALVAAEYQKVIADCLKRLTAGENASVQREIVLSTPDEERKDIDLRASRITYDGEHAVLMTFRDITAHKDRERDLRQFRNAVDHAGHAIFITDTTGSIEYVNPAFEKLTGYTRDEAVGTTPRILKSGEHSMSYYRDLWETILSGEMWHSETINERKTGEQFVVHQTIAPIQDTAGEIQGFVSIQNDITDRQLREQQLEVFHRVLRHNLRNKGSVIQKQASILEQSTASEEETERIRTIRESIKTLLDMSEKAQHARKILEKSIEEDVYRELVGLLEDTVDRVETTYTEAEIRLVQDGSRPGDVDARIAHALYELIENAVKHCHSSSPQVTVTVTVDAGMAKVSIEDNGPGLPDHERRVIERGTENSLEHSSGLGLWFAYWLVNSIGGNISIQTTESGTTITVSVPVQ